MAPRNLSSRSRLGLALLLLVGASLSPACKKKGDAAAKGGEIKVAGASDLVFAMEEIAPQFEKDTGIKVTFIPGSSGKLATQIKEGAPFDVFLSANIQYVDDVIAGGAGLADSKALYARGRLVMWSREGGTPPPDAIDGLADPKYTKIALAQPEHAPYGAAAKQALTKQGVWATIESRVIYGSNIKDTMQLAETGNAEVAFIALALALKAKGKYVEVPDALHDPIDQAMVALKGKNEAGARKFVDYMRSAPMQALLKADGFGPPAM